MTFDDTAIDWLASTLAEAAEAEIMPRFRRLGGGDVRQKTSAADLVTEADVSAERLITAKLRERYPTAMIVGEEACSDNPALLDGLGDADLAFTIDPVDGTFNFASGVPLFGVMLGVVVRGETVAGIIHDPVGKDWLIGARGAGSHIRHAHGNLEKVRVAAPVPISGMTGSVSWQYMAEPERSRLARNQTKILSQFAYRCAAHEYRLLASGHAHFVVYNKLMPWDHLPGVLIHTEAGGHAARFDASAYLPSHVGGGLLVAPDRESWRELRSELWTQ
ncbi:MULTISPECIES: inositol monophosphatase family protein [unclassified Mesorhizobium]|uniref:inositol monophosphatase family protein n=1 Tax=unclassified Mesorhizobium TaxID=325217 RepID=UPI00112E78A7|nr:MULTISPECIES: inositol monophosphatase family protein [unclassified Mesorhizobium]TPJ45834.1 inositol monophosphatase [Mesorhizobium sp. B2-6-6]MBZ9998693.1 inositol monophosphatase family protein [Mesorhizobium sp. B264B2A]MCA0005238.1 inositol monophosphatase family protein [Mesorhizobium sp. B264B1B]MCA0017258.1 inositol monophosphatase family protein [Mesorhizobium sp. B264B1A]TPL12283.1 inositol monophosphatase [Mesorhizobium sp. B2-4-10]